LKALYFAWFLGIFCFNFIHIKKEEKYIMEIRVLHYFLVTALKGNITHAAESLHITQPTLSRQIMQLEDELGVKLFIRGKRTLTLTEEGTLLRQRAEEIVTLVQKTERDFWDQQEFNYGTVSIGCTETLAASVLPHLLKQFSNQYPQIRFELFCGDSDEVKERLDRGITDIGIVREPINSEKYDYVPISELDYWGILLPVNDPLAVENKISLRQISSKPLLLPGRTALLDEISGWFKSSAVNLHILATYNTLSTAIILTQNGVGFAICPQSALQLADNRLVTFRPFSPQYSTRGFIIWKRQQIFTTATTKFLLFIQNAYKAL
jgi:DNA-binding transcriptional LysR family regulator